MSSLTTDQLKRLKKMGQAMAPSSSNQSDDPRFPIQSRSGPSNSLSAAISRIGSAKPDTPEERAKIRRYIMKVARQKGWSSDIPDSWNSGGSLKNGGS